MDLLQRLAAHLSISATPPNIYLDPEEARCEKTKKNYDHHVFQIPFLRAFGLSMIALFVLLHNLYLVPTPSAWADFWRLLTIYTFYIVVSWLILLAWYSKVKAVDLGLFFLLFDIIPFLMAIYYSGGEKSWLFFLLMVRTADQARTTWRNALLFANVSTLGYVLLLVYLGYFERRAMSLSADLTKVCFIYASNVYLSFVSKTADSLRNRMKAAIHVSRDLIGRIEAQSSALQASERDYRALVEGSIQGVYIHQQGAVQLANPAFARILGYESPDVLLGLDHLMLAAPHERDRLEGYLSARLGGRPAPDRYEYQGVRRDGTFVWIECQVSNIAWRSAPATLTTLQDITARRQAEELLQHAHAELETRVRERTAALLQVNEALRASETKYRTLVENIPQKIFIKDRNSCYLAGNEIYARDVGIQSWEFAGKTDYDFFPEELAAKYRADDRRIMESGKTETIEERYIQKGEEVWVQTIKTPIRGEDGTVAGVLGIFGDITERKQLEEDRSRVEAQLRQAQKMEALGTLAGGIAHDFNNILAIILGFTELAKWKLDKESPVAGKLDEVTKAAERAKELVKQILAFSRASEQKKMPVQPGLIVKEALQMLRPSLPSTIEIKTDVLSKAAVLADSTQLHQVLMNLCTNAAYAMQDRGGVLEIRLTDVHLDPESVRLHQGLNPGPHVELTVKDSGQGIDPSILDRIFDPFFTTKEQGAGTGLGLSVVHGIVKSHGGTIAAESLPGAGTTFHVFFPAIEAAAELPSSAEVSLPCGQERILVVDDEPALAETIAARLERLGYQVIFRTNGIEALEAFRQQSAEKPFDLVITDMTMPRMTGLELALELLRLQPDLPIILCSGFSEKLEAEEIETIGIHGFLMKPFVIGELAAMIRKVLDDKSGKSCLNKSQPAL